MIKLKVLIIGSSLVRYLGEYDNTWRHKLECGRDVEFIYRGYRGWSFENFLTPYGQRKLTTIILSQKSDIIIAIIGANSIKTTVDKNSILRNARKFY